MLRRAALLLLSLSASCILDDEHCGANQVEVEGKIEGCVCAPGTVPAPDNLSCNPCGAHEEAKNNACACVTGYSRQGGVCAQTVDSGVTDTGTARKEPTGVGEPCTTANDCATFDATYCQAGPNGSACLVPGCIADSRKCGTGTICCDLSGYMAPAITAAGGFCIPEMSCTAPAKVVAP